MNLRPVLLLAAWPWTLFAYQPSPPSSPAETPLSLFKFDIPTFEFLKLDRTPVVKVTVAPEYPYLMRQAQIEGEVVVDFIVTSEGRVVKASAVQSSNRDFEAAAVAAVNKWKFTPGMKNGRPVNTHMRVPIGFSLNN